MSLERQVKDYCRSLGFDDVGIAAVDGELPFREEVAKAYREGRFGPLDYLERTLEQRLDPRTQFPEIKTVIVVVKNYYTKNHVDFDGAAGSKPKIARYAWGQDYHQWFKKRLKKVGLFLQEFSEAPVKVWPFNDTGPFLERSWAAKAGLGFIGKSAMFIHRGFGTWTFLGGLATDLVLQKDSPYEGPDCGSCTRCLDACPTNALIRPRTVDANKCISTWTIERPLHPDADSMAPRNHSWVFGCDICQEVCPFNKFKKVTEELRFQPKSSRVFLTKETLEEDLRGSPLYRSKKEGLLANLVRIENSLRKKNSKSGDRPASND